MCRFVPEEPAAADRRKPKKPDKPPPPMPDKPKPGVVRRAMCILTSTGEVIPYPRLARGPSGAVDLAALRELETDLVARFGESDA